MSKKKMTPKELEEKRKDDAVKRLSSATNKEIIPQKLEEKRSEVPSKKEMTAEEFSAKRTELAIKLITDSIETPNARQLEKVVLEISSIGLPKIVNFTNSGSSVFPGM
jgi:hypothetical protein